jgi:hypothetical protein
VSLPRSLRNSSKKSPNIIYINIVELSRKGMSRRRRDESRTGGKNLRMNDGVYALRRKVMDIVYEVKEVKDLPRVTVRITENKDCDVLGIARMGGNIIWIPENTVKMTEDELRNVVIHEIGHAVFNLKHDENCSLMCAHLDEILSKDECLEIVKEW